jgi:hypothetical protein
LKDGEVPVVCVVTFAELSMELHQLREQAKNLLLLLGRRKVATFDLPL